MGRNCRLIEVGSGTGAVLQALRSLAGSDEWKMSGLDISQSYLLFSKEINPTISHTQGDAHHLPYKSKSFDLAFCHFLLLWVGDPITVIREMKRIVVPGGWVAVLAEPDYGGRIEMPSELARLGELQDASLSAQGANTRMGRLLKGIFYKNGFLDLEIGIIGAQWKSSSADFEENLNEEWDVIREDLKDSLTSEELEPFRQIDLEARISGERFIFVPTFYGMGRSPMR